MPRPIYDGLVTSCRHSVQRYPITRHKLLSNRHFSHSPSSKLYNVTILPNWELKTFQENAFHVNKPAKLPFLSDSLPPACHKWFIHDNAPDRPIASNKHPKTSELRTSFWSEHESILVPLELTTSSPPTNKPTPPEFHRTHAPLQILLTYLSNPSTTQEQTHSIYLAQCDLTSLPSTLQHDLPTPSLVTRAGKGDIYASSLWLGRPPTYTPLHRDPNPNLFLQLAGHKTVRLLPPEIGDAVFDQVKASGTSASFRGEEMMAGPEREVLHRLVWEGTTPEEGVMAYMCQAEVGMGEGLFIPKGWWHSVKGVGEGVTASANWWFR